MVHSLEVKSLQTYWSEKIMFKQVSILLLICFAGLSAFAQTEKYAAPVKWERYKVSDRDVSLALPKLPVLVAASTNVCFGEETKEYAAYADRIVYGFTFTSRVDTPKFCSNIKDSREFDERNFSDRLVSLKKSSPESTETNFKQNNVIVNKVTANSKTYWLINDYENKRWFELWIMGGNEEKDEVKNFIKSIALGKNAQGIEIGNGADRTYGDEILKTDSPKGDETNSITIAVKPQPRYTDAARKAGIQGKVQLKVFFLANGGIGSVTPISELKFGLTEEAISAAQRVVFIPARRNGVAYSIVKTIEYSFSIY